MTDCGERQPKFSMDAGCQLLIRQTYAFANGGRLSR